MLVGKKAPPFTAKAVVQNEVVEDFSLEKLRGKYVILFFYPLDFTFVCPTELVAFQELLAAFRTRNAEVVACSVDSAFSHLAWLKTPRNQGGIEGVEYPLVSDLNKQISLDYQVLSVGEGVAYRGLFLIDKEGIIRHQSVNDLPLGRSTEEALRLLDALINHEKHGEVCPANWQVGKPALFPNQKSTADYLGGITS